MRKLMILAALTLLPAPLWAQTTAPLPPGESRDFPAPATVEGKPIETRPPEKSDDHPLFPGQTRAPFHATAPYQVTTITDKLHAPWSLAFLPDGKFLITERENPAALRIVDARGVISPPLTGLTPLAAPGKLGLLDVVLDPNFSRNHRIYFAFFERLAKGYSNTNLAHAVLDEAGGALHDVTVIFRGTPTLPEENFSLKQGGRIVFARDGSVFMSMGDRDGNRKADYAQALAQHLDNDAGKIIHLTAEGLPAADNPFLKTQGALPEIWALGIRSPEGFAMDPKTGALWETEHGPRGGDELNLIQRGKNYGWPTITHGLDYPGDAVGEGIVAKEGLEQPVYYWDPVIAPSGLAFYSGKLFPQWKNSIFVGGLRGVMLDRLTLVNNRIVAEEPLLTELHTRIRDVRVGPDGAVYVLTDTTKFLKLTPK
jgi:glucose/arabinose dehydrogenase